ncbi:MAG: UTRA domain-containing protein, partial [Kiloniellales bacterium]|nr:UTRA domain-containing protein [Kiloniellales bacterium]
GTYVAGPKPQSAAMEVRSIKAEIEGRGHSYAAKVQILRRETAGVLEADRLDLQVGDPIFHSVILHLENDIPIQLEERFVNPKMAPAYLDQDFTVVTPYDYLITACPLSEAEHIILAVIPDKQTRDLLAMEEGQPCLLLRRRTWSGGIPVTFALLSHPGDRYRLGARFKGA